MREDPARSESVEQQLTTILESIEDGFFACDAELRFIYINVTAERVLGVNRNELLGTNCREVFPLTLFSRMEEEFRLAAAGETRLFENFYEPLGRWFQNRCIPRKGGGIVFYFKDITDHKLADEALLRERNVLQSVMDGAKNSYLVYLDRDFNFVRVNKTYAATCGYRSEEMIGRNHFILYPHAENEAIFTRVRDTGEPFEVHDKPFVFPDHPEWGVTYWDWTLTAVKDQTGEVTGLVLSLYDTTGRKRAEEALQASEKQYRLLFEQHSAIMFLVDPVNGNILNANKAASEFYGYTRKNLRKMNINQISCLPQDEISARIQEVRDRKAGHFVGPHRLANGAVRTVEVHVKQIFFQNQEFDFAIIHDITERKMAEDQLQAMNDELERRVEQRTVELFETQKQYLHAEKLSAIGKLSASIAHEINNPLQGILTILSGQRKIEVLAEEDRQLLDVAISEVYRIKDLIRSLQDFYRPSSGKKIHMDVHRSLDALLLLLKSDFKSKRIAVELDLAEQLPQIFAVADQIKQVFLNLLTNAAEACLQSGGVITVRTRQEGDKVAVTIKDTGVGITADGMEQIFRPFFTTKPGIKGIGLGLAVSYGIVKKHGGEILVTSEPGKGATFTVLLPITGAPDLAQESV